MIVIDLSHMLPLLYKMENITAPNLGPYRDYDIETIVINEIEIDAISIKEDNCFFNEIQPILPDKVLNVINASMEDMLSSFSLHHHTVEKKTKLIESCSILFQTIVDSEMLKMDEYNHRYNLVPMSHYSYTYNIRIYGGRLLLSLYVDKYMGYPDVQD